MEIRELAMKEIKEKKIQYDILYEARKIMYEERERIRKEEEEKARIKREQEAERKRIEEEKVAEVKRIEQEKKEAERLLKEKKAEEQRLYILNRVKGLLKSDGYDEELANKMTITELSTINGYNANATTKRRNYLQQLHLITLPHDYKVKCPMCREINDIKVNNKRLIGAEATCCVCMEAKVDVYLQNCGHTCLCTECCSRLEIK